MSWIQTFSGKKIWPGEPWKNEPFMPDCYCMEDIAHSLSMQCRFNGHTEYFYSVAQHSWIVADALFEKYGPRYALDGLMHDASEAYLCDIPRPIKQNLPMYKNMESVLTRQIYDSLSIIKTQPSIIKEYDDRALYAEALQLFPMQIDNWVKALNVEPLDINLIPYYGPIQAKAIFLSKYDRYRELVKKEEG